MTSTTDVQQIPQAAPTSSRWRLADIPWAELQPAMVDRELLLAVKAAAVVEANSADYVTYLHNVFADDEAFQRAASHWGEEEAQHGAALGLWAERIDRDFDFADCLQRFRAGYRIPLAATTSVRGSPAAELLARCIVESGTCSFYSALRDHAREPVLKFICHRIAQDEVRHYRLFQQHGLRYRATQPMGLLRRLRVAGGRLGETADDELGYAFYSANLGGTPGSPAYDRVACTRRYQAIAAGIYGRPHLHTLVAMISRALGFKPAIWPQRALAYLAWAWLRLLRKRASQRAGLFPA